MVPEVHAVAAASGLVVAAESFDTTAAVAFPVVVSDEIALQAAADDLPTE